MKKDNSNSDIEIARENHLFNRKEMIENFKSVLKDTSAFAIRAAILTILDQENYVKHLSKNTIIFTNFKDEKKVLDTLVEYAKNAYGKEYEKRYMDVKKEKIDNK